MNAKRNYVSSKQTWKTVCVSSGWCVRHDVCGFVPALVIHDTQPTAVNSEQQQRHIRRPEMSLKLTRVRCELQIIMCEREWMYIWVIFAEQLWRETEREQKRTQLVKLN